jgi:type I restriction enzyme M protein
MADLVFIPVADKIQNTSYRIYDGAFGTGGMLTVAEERIQELAAQHGKRVSIHLYGQENADETYAIARADMLIKGEGDQAENIYFGSTISEDGFSGKTFDFMISNPPFGTPWKKDIISLGFTEKEKAKLTDARFRLNFDGLSDYSVLPNIGDPQMLFLANNIAKIKQGTAFGSRIVEVHNGSSLFTGDAGQGESNLRRYIIENDLLECIVALPEKMFYNTGIGTFLWILSNKKPPLRKGKIQLIDATSMKSPLRKNLGEKNSEITETIRKDILKLYAAFDKVDPTYSRVFPNAEFGYYKITICRPKYGDDGNPLIETQGKRKGLPVINKAETDKEQVPFLYNGGVNAVSEFFKTEILPFVPDVFIDDKATIIGYELSFTKYFYKPAKLRPLAEIIADIRVLEQDTDGLLKSVLEDCL